jgi:hypothetical protein
MSATGEGPYRELFAAFALLYVKVFAACANFPLVRGYPNGDLLAPSDGLCHFDRREKFFLDPSHSLGMTGLRRSLCCLCARYSEFWLRLCCIRINVICRNMDAREIKYEPS